jgi:hypothetical protein
MNQVLYSVTSPRSSLYCSLDSSFVGCLIFCFVTALFEVLMFFQADQHLDVAAHVMKDVKVMAMAMGQVRRPLFRHSSFYIHFSERTMAERES